MIDTAVHPLSASDILDALYAADVSPLLEPAQAAEEAGLPVDAVTPTIWEEYQNNAEPDF